MQEPELLLSLDEEFDLNLDDLSCFISPKNTSNDDSNTDGMNDQLACAKISPLITNELQLEVSRPSISSVRGYDTNNNPVFSSSQTPHDFQTMTKRKTSKKSIFNFEEVADVSHNINKIDKQGKVKNVVLSNTIPHRVPGDSRFDSQHAIVANCKSIDSEGSRNPRKKQTSKTDLFDDSLSVDLTNNEYDSEFCSNYSLDNVQIIDNTPLLGNSNNISLNSSTNWATSTSALQYPTDYSDDSRSITLPSISNALYCSSSNYLLSDLPPIPAESLLNNSHGSNETSNAFANSYDYQNFLQMKVQNLQLNPSNPSLESSSISIGEDVFDKSFIPNFDEDTIDKASVNNDKASVNNPTKDFNNSIANNRASKSLTEISRRFVIIYGKDNTLDYIAGLVDPTQISEPSNSFNRVDAAAENLNVHVRRIYELIKILEILSLVAFAGDKRGKFSWRGTKQFLYTLGLIQNEGIKKFPSLAAQMGLQLNEQVVPEVSNFNRAGSFDKERSKWNQFSLLDNETQETLDFLSSFDKNEEASRKTSHGIGISTTVNKKTSISGTIVGQEETFMVEVICKRFLQLFLVGMNTLSMSTAIQKLIPIEEQQSIADYNKLNATKIRRVYDVTNVLCSLNLIRKKSIPKIKALKAEVCNSIDCPSANESAKKALLEYEAEGINKPNKKNGGKSCADRSDTKILEWSSFSPQIIRQHYLQYTISNNN